ncbi:MAG: OmpH family outer membrane protein [Puniceicoccales bacterium]|jgi:Skp family chaperone for outer membrane proteins|nr:OmpH family outer membrane protein [Puniceicoccales bacterium]
MKNMKSKSKRVATIVAVCLLCMTDVSAVVQKILSVDVQKVFEKYENAKAAQVVFSETVAAANKELKELGDALTKLQEEISTLNEKVGNTALLDSIREKSRQEAEEKTEILRVKEGEFIQFRQDLNRKLTEHKNRDLATQLKAIEDATAVVAKAKKADIVINKIPGALYVDDSLDITQLIIDELNSKQK